jgi:hypothetical protein
VVFSLFLGRPALAWKPDYIPSPEQLKKMEKRNEKRRRELNTTAILFGKVIDFSGEPVSGAVVTMRLSAVPKSVLYNDQRLVNTVTDSEGAFQFEETGFMYYLVDIKSDGYQFKMDYNKTRSLEFRPIVTASQNGYVPSRPLVFKIRKKAPPSFVLVGNWSFGLRAGNTKLLDLYRREWTSPDRLSGKILNNPDWQADIAVSVEENDGSFRLVLESVGKASGFVVATPGFVEEMTEAPEQGYRPKLVIPIAKNSAGTLYAYVKNDGGLFYSKIRINYANLADRDYVELDCGYFTNVTGWRGLEFVSELAAQYRRDAKAQRRSWVKREQLTSGGVIMPIIGVE